MYDILIMGIQLMQEIVKRKRINFFYVTALWLYDKIKRMKKNREYHTFATNFILPSLIHMFKLLYAAYTDNNKIFKLN